jgi:hypothetical protein
MFLFPSLRLISVDQLKIIERTCTPATFKTAATQPTSPDGNVYLAEIQQSIIHIKEKKI